MPRPLPPTNPEKTFLKTKHLSSLHCSNAPGLKVAKKSKNKLANKAPNTAEKNSLEEILHLKALN